MTLVTTLQIAVNLSVCAVQIVLWREMRRSRAATKKLEEAAKELDAIHKEYVSLLKVRKIG